MLEKPFAFYYQIIINYPSGPRKVELSDKKAASIVKYMALGLPRLAIAALLNKCTDITDVKNILFKEMLTITSKKEPSVLRQTHHNVLPSFQLAAFVEE